jgi:hypothetical protein
MAAGSVWRCPLGDAGGDAPTGGPADRRGGRLWHDLRGLQRRAGPRRASASCRRGPSWAVRSHAAWRIRPALPGTLEGVPSSRPGSALAGHGERSQERSLHPSRSRGHGRPVSRARPRGPWAAMERRRRRLGAAPGGGLAAMPSRLVWRRPRRTHGGGPPRRRSIRNSCGRQRSSGRVGGRWRRGRGRLGRGAATAGARAGADRGGGVRGFGGRRRRWGVR